MVGLGRTVGCATVAVLAAGAVAAEEPVPPPRPSHNLYGVTGLIDMPTAEMQPDGQVTLTSSYFGGFLRNTISAQILPGVEAAFRYSVVEDFNAKPAGNNSLFDRSFDIRLRLVEEGIAVPGVVVGLQDFLGTGIYSGEYIAATKTLDAGEAGTFKLTGGVGWGRLAGLNAVTNPLRALSSSFGDRGEFDGTGGNVEFGRYFQGAEMGYFGGIEWATPIEGLTAKVEYSPDLYERERLFSSFDPVAPVNLGLEYRPTDGIEIGAYYMYGSEFGVRLSFSGNPFRPIDEYDSVAGPQPLLPRQPPEEPSAELAALGDLIDLITDRPPTTPLGDRRLKSIVVHERLGSVRWAEAVLAAGVETDRCPTELALAADAELGVVDVVTFTGDGGEPVCTVALRAAGQDAVRLTTAIHAEYPTDWYEQEAERTRIVADLAEELSGDQIGLLGIEIAPHRVQVYIENDRFRSTPRAVGRTARALTRTMPPSVEVFEITPVENSLASATIVLGRSSLEDQVNRPEAEQRSWATAKIKSAEPIAWENLVNVSDDMFPRLSWSVSPALPVNLFDPDQPARFDLSVIASGKAELLPGLSLNASIGQRIIGDLDDIDRESDSLVDERVRSDIAEYLATNTPVITRLSGDYVTKFTPSLFGRMSIGILERMYAGISAELLWKPADQSWGIGVEGNFVRQRGFEQRFSLRNYETFTGHVSLYWDTNWHDVSVQVDAGRYLAGDWGGTFSAKRRFDNGWEIGGFFTLTDLPFSEFGEGSFDKGLYLTIPLNWALPYESQSEITSTLRPLTRDGGARLIVSNRLYPMVEDLDEGGLESSWGGFWE